MEINKALFYNICYNVTVSEHERYNIGTYKEKKMHIILKNYFEQDTQYHEIPYKGFIADIKRNSDITEIETNGLSGKCDKLAAFLPECRVNIVLPVAAERNVSWVDPDTGVISKKHTARIKKSVYDIFYEIYKIKDYVKDENLTLTAVSLAVDEYRMLDGWSKDRKRGSSRYEKIPTDILDIEQFNTDADYLSVVPDECQQNFTASQFSKSCGITSEIGYSTLAVLCARGVIVKGEKVGRAYVYSRV